MSPNVSPHDLGHNWCVLLVGLAIQNAILGRLGSEGKSCKSVHDKVYPEHLNGSERRVFKNDGAQEDNKHGHHVDSELEL